MLVKQKINQLAEPRRRKRLAKVVEEQRLAEENEEEDDKLDARSAEENERPRRQAENIKLAGLLTTESRWYETLTKFIGKNS